MSKTTIFLVLAFLASLALLGAGQPALSAALAARAGWIFLLAAAWWLAGRVMSGK